MKIRRLAIISILAFSLVACAETSPDTPLESQPTETVTETVVTPPTTSKTTSSAAETTTELPLATDLTPRYLRQDLKNYQSANSEEGQVSFASADGAITCEFRPLEQDAPLNREPSLDWRLGFAQGGCAFGANYVAVDSGETFSDLSATAPHSTPETYTPLEPGTYLDLHTMGCFADTADAIACTKYATNETFRIDGAGLTMLSPEQKAEVFSTEYGLYQSLSSVAEFHFADGNVMSCFFETPGSEDFWCQSLSRQGWDDGNNLLHLKLSDGHIEVVGSQVGNPGLDYFRGRQPIEAPNSLLDASLAVHHDGNRVRFSTASGEELWVGLNAYGLGVES